MRKKEFTSFDISAAIHELKNVIADSRVNNIHQQGEKTLVFKLHKIDQPPIRLVLEAGKRLHLTSYAQENPAEPPPFCMALRRNLRGAWLVGIEQYEFERIVTVTFRKKEGPLKLVVELFGEGNIILTDEKNTILQALEFKKMRDRDILRNQPLVFPPPSGKNPFKVTQQELQEALKAAGEAQVVKTAARLLGIGGVYAEEVLQIANIEKTTQCKDLTEEQINAIYSTLHSMLSRLFEGKLEPAIMLDEEGNFMDCVPLKLKRYEGCKIQEYPTFNQALDEFYLRVTAAESTIASLPQVDKLKQESERLKRMVADQEKSIAEEERKAERDKIIGDTIYAHFNELQGFVNLLLKANSQGQDWSTIIAQVMAAKKTGKVPSVYVEGFDGRNLALNLFMDNLHFSFNLRSTMFENANEYYEKGKKARQKIAGASVAIESSKKQLSLIENDLKKAETLKSLKPAEIIEALAKKKVELENRQWYEKFRWFTSSEGFLVVAGKDTVSNEVLIKKYSKEEDVVFHAEITGAPFTVIKTEGKQVGEQTLKEAGEYAASYSRAWRENAGSADVYWVKPDQLAKSGPSGESVPHGAFFVVGKRNWLRNMPLRTAIGIIVNEKTSFIGGPVEAVKAKTKSYIVLLPGDNQGKELLKQIMKSLMLKLTKEQREKTGKTSIEQIREYVPYTKGIINLKPT